MLVDPVKHYFYIWLKHVTKNLRASGLHHSKKNHENRLARSLSLQKKYELSNLQNLLQDCVR